MQRVLVSNPVMVRDLDHYRPELAVAGIDPVPYRVKQFLTEEDLLPIIADFDGAIAGDDEYTARVLEVAAPRLKVISKWGTGLDSIDLEAARRFGIKVSNSPGAFADAVADVAIGYMLMLTRRLHVVDREVRGGGWPKPEGETLRGKTLGLIGFGAIGRAVAVRARAFGLNVVANDIRMAEMDPAAGVTFAPSEDVLAGADYVCLCCNLTPENRRMIDGAALATMERSAYLVNVARGALVDELALVRALRDGRLAGAALDVYETEPLPADHPFMRMPNVVLGSHNANNARGANEYVSRNTIANLLVGLGLAPDAGGRRSAG